VWKDKQLADETLLAKLNELEFYKEQAANFADLVNQSNKS